MSESLCLQLMTGLAGEWSPLDMVCARVQRFGRSSLCAANSSVAGWRGRRRSQAHAIGCCTLLAACMGMLGTAATPEPKGSCCSSELSSCSNARFSRCALAEGSGTDVAWHSMRTGRSPRLQPKDAHSRIVAAGRHAWRSRQPERTGCCCCCCCALWRICGTWRRFDTQGLFRARCVVAPFACLMQR